MKKATVFLFSFFMILNLAACGNSAGRTEESVQEEDFVESSTDNGLATENQEEDNTESIKDAEPTEAADTSETDKGADTSEADKGADTSEMTEDTDTAEGGGTKVLVAYFSATNTTKGVAEQIANGLDADLYEIVPAEPYTEADLDYNDNNSRTTIEMDDPDARPGISGSVENMEQYEIVFIGYPIWWGEAPRIVSTFMESYDFSGKTIVPFCTSGGSGIGSSADNLEQLTMGATWLAGQRLNGKDSQETVMEWVDSLALDLSK